MANPSKKSEMAKYIGNNIYTIRKKLKLTREELAEKSNLSPNHIYELEMGNSIPTVVTLIDICNALNISISEITDSLIFNETNKYIESISKDFNKLTEKEKSIILELIKYMANN